MGKCIDRRAVEFERALAQFIDEHVGQLGPATVAEALEALSGRVDEALAPTVIARGSNPLRLAVKFYDADSLEDALDKLASQRILELPIAGDVPTNADVQVTLLASRVIDAQSLFGRVVHRSGDKLLVHLARLDEQAQQCLARWPEQMRSFAGPGDAENRKPGARNGARSPSGCSQQAPRKGPAKPRQSAAPKPPTRRSFVPTHASPKEQWRLDDTPLDSILKALAAQDGAGVLRLQGDATVEIVVEAGQYYALRAKQAGACPTVIDLVEQKGKVDPARADRLRKVARDRGITAAKAMLDTAHPSSRASVASCVRAHARRLLTTLQAKVFSTARYYALNALPEQVAEVPTPLLEVVFARVKSAQLTASSTEHSADDLRHLRMARKCCSPVSVSHLNLNLSERQTFDVVLSEHRTYRQIADRSPLGACELDRFLVALDFMGVLDSESVGLHERTVSWNEKHSLAHERLASIEREPESRPFEVLGLHWTTYDGLLERRSKELVDCFRVLNQPLGLEACERRRLRAAREKIERAHRALSDATARMHWRADHVPDKQVAKTIHCLDALAREAMQARAFSSALDFYQRLLELDPHHAEASQTLPYLLAGEVAG